MSETQTTTMPPAEILVVEDDPASLQLLVSLLEKAGYRVRPATDAALALRSVQARVPDLVLLDVRLPDTDGFEVCRQLKARPETRDVPVIFLSALDDTDSRVKGFEVGAVDFVSKPLQKAELLARVRTHVALRQVQRDLETANAQLRAATAVLEEARITLYSIGDGMIATDVAGLVTRMNRAAEDMTGWTEAEAMGHPLDEVFHIVNEDTGSEVPSPVARVLRDGVVIGLANHTKLIARDGIGRPIADSGAPIRLADGATCGAVLVFSDQSADREARRALATAEERFRRFFDDAPIGKAITAPDGRMLRVNPAFGAMLGYSLDEMHANSFLAVTHPDDVAASQEHIRSLVAGERDFLTFDKRYLARDGHTVWARVTTRIHRDSAGTPLYFMTHVVDETARLQSEATLRASEAKFSAVFHSAPDAILLTRGTDDRIADVNEAATLLSGYSAGELLGRTTVELGLWADPEAREAYRRRIAAEGRVVDFETIFKAKARVFPGIVSGQIVHLSNGPHYLTVIRDISERKAAEQAAERESRRVEALLRMLRMRDASIADLTQVAVDEMASITGSAQAFIGRADPAERTLRIYLWSGNVNRVCTIDGSTNDLEFSVASGGLWADAVRNREPVVVNDYCPSDARACGTPAGHVPLKRFLGVPALHDGRVELLAGLANKAAPYDDTDVREASLLLEELLEILARREAVASLTTEHDNLAAIFDASPTALIVLDPDLQIVWANASMAQLVDRGSAKDLVGHRPGEAFDCRHSSFDPRGCGFSPDCKTCPVRNAVVSVLAAGPTIRATEVAVERGPAGPLASTLLLRLGVERFSIGGRPHVVVALEDVTEIRRLEEEHRRFESVARQQQKLEAIGTLASGVAHEINNPLNTVMNFAQLIDDDARAPRQVHEYARHVLAEAERMAGIVRNLLSFSRERREPAGTVYVSDLISSTLLLVQSVLRKDGITVETDVASEADSVRCVRQQAQQILLNLLTNARDALNDRFPGQSSEKRIRLAAIRILRDGHEGVLLTVEDNGSGVPSKIKERIFDPFFTTKPRDKGTGLGLSISFGIAKENNGDLWLDDEPSAPTRFCLFLPVDAAGSREEVR